MVSSKKEAYLKVLIERAISSGQRLMVNNFTFMLDNDMYELFKTIRKRFQFAKIMERLPQSSNLNPIEKLWGIVWTYRLENDVQRPKNIFRKFYNPNGSITKVRY